MNTKEIIEQTDKYYLPVFGRNQIALDHGKGCKLYDAEGREYTDFLAGIAVNGLGHAHPAIVKAISEQAGKIIHSSNLYYTEIQAKAIKVISEVTGFDRVFLCNSGAEANEGALKLSRKYGVAKDINKFRIISAVHSFHGRTMATLTATGQDHYHEGLNPLPIGYEYVPYGDIAALEEIMDENVCGILLEPIQGEGGVNVPSNEYLLRARALCDKYDALLIFDEIQSGICRTGQWFAWEYSGARPDVMTMAKAMGGGFPMGAFVTTERLAHVFAPGDHGSTFGGNPLSCAAAYASLTTMREMKLEQVAAKTGAYFKMQLEALQKQFPDKILEVRGRGLILGMELSKPGAPVVKGCLERGMIINCTASTVLRFVPPLIISEKEIDELMLVLKEVLEEF